MWTCLFSGKVPFQRPSSFQSTREVAPVVKESAFCPKACMVLGWVAKMKSYGGRDMVHTIKIVNPHVSLDMRLYLFKLHLGMQAKWDGASVPPSSLIIYRGAFSLSSCALFYRS